MKHKNINSLALAKHGVFAESQIMTTSISPFDLATITSSLYELAKLYRGSGRGAAANFLLEVVDKLDSFSDSFLCNKETFFEDSISLVYHETEKV